MNPNENKDFDKKLREKFEGFRPEAPEGLWDKIAAQLDDEESRSVVSVSPKRRRFPTWWIAVAATLLVVCGLLYWQSRPVSVTYLHAHMNPVEEPEKTGVKPSIPVEAPQPVTEPLDLERLKRVFAKKSRDEQVKIRSQPVARERRPEKAVPAESVEPQRLEASKPRGSSSDELFRQRDSLGGEKTEIAGVPDIEPLVVLEEEEETMLASSAQTKQPFGLSNILNYVVSTVDQRDEKLVTFSNDEEGSLKLDFNFGLAKNRKKKLK